MPVTNRWFKPPGKQQPRFLLATHPSTPPKPGALLGVHSSANGLDFARNADFGHTGEAFIALFGDQSPVVGKVLHPVGFKVVRVDTRSGVIKTFATNKGKKSGPASYTGGKGFERPIAVRFNPTGGALYVVDFGVMLETKRASHPFINTGALWPIVRQTAQPP